MTLCVCYYYYIIAHLTRHNRNEDMIRSSKYLCCEWVRIIERIENLAQFTRHVLCVLPQYNIICIIIVLESTYTMFY